MTFKISAKEKEMIVKRRKAEGYNPIEEVNPDEEYYERMAEMEETIFSQLKPIRGILSTYHAYYETIDFNLDSDKGRAFGAVLIALGYNLLSSARRSGFRKTYFKSFLKDLTTFYIGKLYKR